jgi:NADH-quinone oxidoreductase subunit J
VAFVLGMGVLAQLTYVTAEGLGVLPEAIAPEAAAASASAGAIGLTLFTQYALLLEMIGILLLAATIGAVMIARRRML